MLRTLLAALSFLLFLPVACYSQSALDGFDPHADAPVRAVVVQPDGKILIGGEFTSLAPNGGATVTRNHIARLNADGSLDAGFNPDASGNVYAIALQANGDILIGGSFGSVGGQQHALIARLSGTTGAPDNFGTSFNMLVGAAVYAIAVQPDGNVIVGGNFFNPLFQSRNILRYLPNGNFDYTFYPNANNIVRAIAVQTNGKILVGGDFTGFTQGSTFYQRNYIARLNAVIGVPDYYDPNANLPVYALAIQNDNMILVGGQFGNIGGANRVRLARLDPLSGLADSFRANGDVDLDVYSIVVQPDCKILVGGTFQFFGIPPGGPAGIVRLLPDGTRDLSFKLNVSNVYAVALQPDGKIIFGGGFTNVGSAGQQMTPRLCIARYESDGTVDRTLNINVVGTLIQATAIQPDGKILIGGQFTDMLGAHRDNIARLNPDGTLDTTFNPGVTGSVNAIIVEADGSILVGGGYTSIAGQMRNNLARLDATGALDLTFNPNPNGFIVTLVEQWNGAILVGGAFTNIGGQTRNNLARLDPVTGAAEMAFNPNPNPMPFSSVSAIAVQTDGKILVGGNFTTIAGQMRDHVVRLDAGGALDAAFTPVQTNSTGTGVFVIAIQENGKILLGGDFTMLAGQMRNRMARLDANGALDLTFNPNANNTVLSIAVQADGRILAGGHFTSIGGQPVRNRIARLNGTTGAADSFDPNANGIVRALMLQADGKLLAGGDFTGAGGQMRNLFARLTNDTPALQNFTAIINPMLFFQSISTWTLGGASPQLLRVSFESSFDGVSYGFANLNVPYSGTSWTYNVFNAPFRSFIRARGYVRGGQVNGSGGIIEAVRCHTDNPFPAGRAAVDFDGDGHADVSVFRSSVGYWYISQSSNNAFRATPFGANGDRIVPGDYDGDGKTDTAVFRPSNGYWYTLNSSNGAFRATQFGQAGDIPSAGDYDGDGKADISLYRQSTGTFYLLYSTDGSFHFQQWGQAGDLPVMGDYDGDARTDFGIFRPALGTFYILRSLDGTVIGQQFGQSGDNPIAGDFDGDGKTDIAVYRPAAGGWYMLQSRDNGFKGVAWGAGGDVPAAADYDGDGKWDVAVFRPATGTFYVLQSKSNSLRADQFGTNGDVPVANAFVQ